MKVQLLASLFVLSNTLSTRKSVDLQKKKIFQPNFGDSTGSQDVSALDDLILSNPFKPSTSNSLAPKEARGTWKIAFAPHIKILENVLGTSFTVFYKFGESGRMESYVKYNIKWLPQYISISSGFLNTEGSFRMINNGKSCEITWKSIWWDGESDMVRLFH